MLGTMAGRILRDGERPVQGASGLFSLLKLRHSHADFAVLSGAKE